jgi:ornithine cyclodeaminase
MEEALRAMARGEAFFPPREAVVQPDKKGVLGLMPGYFGPKGVIGLKAVSVFPGNLGTPYEAHQGAVLLFETTNGRLLALVDAGSITNIRTAAVSGVATEALSRRDVAELAILGSGSQAASHLETMLVVRPKIERVKIWSRTKANAKRLADRASAAHEVEIKVEERAEDAVRGAGLICTTTGAISPILKGVWLEPGAHVNAVGASRPPIRELDTEAVAKSRFFVDSRESAHIESDDFRIPKQEGAIDDSHILGELGEVLEGRVQGRTSADDITVFKSLGLAIEDLAAAHYVYSQALSRQMGTWVDFVSERHD